MKKNLDHIIFDSKYEVIDILNALDEWKKTHSKSDEKRKSVEELYKLLDVMEMEW